MVNNNLDYIKNMCFTVKIFKLLTRDNYSEIEEKKIIKILTKQKKLDSKVEA